MLDELKRSIVSQSEGTETESLMLEAAVSTDIKDAFLDNPQVIVQGSENDPEVRKLVEGVPGYDEESEESIKRDLKSLTESISETQF